MVIQPVPGCAKRVELGVLGPVYLSSAPAAMPRKGEQALVSDCGTGGKFGGYNTVTLSNFRRRSTSKTTCRLRIAIAESRNQILVARTRRQYRKCGSDALFSNSPPPACYAWTIRGELTADRDESLNVEPQAGKLPIQRRF